MMNKTVVTLILSMIVVLTYGQNMQSNRNIQNTENKKTTIYPDIRVWRMTDSYTHADTIPIDTILNEHQIHNPIWRYNVSNVTLGNYGSPSQSSYYPTIAHHEGNIFFDVLNDYMDNPDKFEYYNTKTPYSNFTYQMGYPKRRSEEYVHILFTQNVNRRLNVGFKYKLSSSIGRYESQRADHVSFRLFSSFDGDYYKFNFSGIYHKADIKENGGILNDNYILYPDSFEYEKPEDIPVQFMDQKNRTSRYQLLFSHALDLVHIDRYDNDSNTIEIPVATIYHKLYIDKSHHEYRIGDLSNYKEIADELFPNIFNDTLQTADSIRYFHIGNEFQLKLNEEFNNLLRFGLRAYIGNDIRQYHWPAQSIVTTDEKGKKTIHYKQNDEKRVTTYVGGQIFKNLGENLHWSAGAKVYFQGYRSGDFCIDGNVTTQFNILGLSAEVYANGKVELRSPSLFEEKYMSNHYSWDNGFESTKTVNINGGIKIPNIKLELSVFSATSKKQIYFDENGYPSQYDDVVQVTGAYLRKQFSGAGFNSINRITLQKTTVSDVVPLPTFAVYSTDFYEHEFFGVLMFQLGFDFRYNSAYYTPKYNASIMQFCAQDERKIGNYFYLDPFINFHIKRVRFYAKYEHLNKGWVSKDYFNTIHYPANPGTFKIGISWNFYD